MDIHIYDLSLRAKDIPHLELPEPVVERRLCMYASRV